MAKKKTLSDLGALTSPEPEAPEVADAAAPPADSAEITADNAEVTADADDSPPSPPVQEEAPLREQQLDKHGRAYATGRRKDAVARVWLKPGSGRIVINEREQE